MLLYLTHDILPLLTHSCSGEGTFGLVIRDKDPPWANVRSVGDVSWNRVSDFVWNHFHSMVLHLIYISFFPFSQICILGKVHCDRHCQHGRPLEDATCGGMGGAPDAEILTDNRELGPCQVAEVKRGQTYAIVGGQEDPPQQLTWCSPKPSVLCCLLVAGMII